MPGVIDGIPSVHFPKHAKPRVWLVTSFTCPTGQCVTKLALAHGDSVVAGILPGGTARRHEAPDRTEALHDFWQQADKEGWKERIKIVKLDGRFRLYPRRPSDLTERSLISVAWVFVKLRWRTPLVSSTESIFYFTAQPKVRLRMLWTIEAVIVVEIFGFFKIVRVVGRAKNMERIDISAFSNGETVADEL